MWKIVLTKTAEQMLLSIRDRRMRSKIQEKINSLRENPEQQGKPLTGNLMGLRSVRAVGQRYRIIYRVEGEQITIIVVAVGIRSAGSRKDIYELALRLVQMGLYPPKQ